MEESIKIMNNGSRMGREKQGVRERKKERRDVTEMRVLAGTKKCSCQR